MKSASVLEGALLFAAAGLALGLGALLWIAQDRSPVGTLSPAVIPSSERGAREDRPELPEAGLGLSQVTGVVREVSVAPSVEELEWEGQGALSCLVTGKLVDESDSGIAGVEVRLIAASKSADDKQVPLLLGKGKYHGPAVLSAPDGSFVLEAPAPSSGLALLTVTPDAFHDTLRIVFGGDDAASRPPLRAGETDLGQLMLVSTGSISGRITGYGGDPIENASVRGCTEAWNSLGREARSDESGFYRIDRLRPGILGVEVAADGWQSRFREPIEVVAGRITAGIDFELERAQTLSGRVVDEAGEPLAEARLICLSRATGTAARGRSADDGRFVLCLPEEDVFRLIATLDGYVPYGSAQPAQYYAPDTADIVITLKRCPTTRFRIVDEETGDPVVRFGMRIEWNKGMQASPRDESVTDARPKVGDHLGGELELPARPGLDTFQVIAPGYALLEGEVEHSSESSNLQVLRLSRGSCVRGRVVFQGKPVSGARVRLERGYLDWTEAPEEFAARLTDSADSESDRQGHFEIAGLVPGVYRVRVIGSGGETVALPPFRLRRRSVRELGDVVLFASATLTGRVLPPETVAATGLRVGLDEVPAGIDTTTDAEGRFRFEGLAPGPHRVWLAPAPGRIAPGDPLQVELEAGRTLDVELDARERGVCAVTAFVRVNAEHLQGARVLLKPLTRSGSVEVGTTDAEGRAFGHVRAVGRARVVVIFPWWTELEHPLADVELVHGKEVEFVVNYELGELEIEMPSTFELPTRGQARVLLRPIAGGEPISVLLEFLEERIISDSGLSAASIEGNLLRVVGLPSGGYDAEFHLWSFMRSDVSGLEFDAIGRDERLSAISRLHLLARNATRWRLTSVDLR